MMVSAASTTTQDRSSLPSTQTYLPGYDQSSDDHLENRQLEQETQEDVDNDKTIGMVKALLASREQEIQEKEMEIRHLKVHVRTLQGELEKSSKAIDRLKAGLDRVSAINYGFNDRLSRSSPISSPGEVAGGVGQAPLGSTRREGSHN